VLCRGAFQDAYGPTQPIRKLDVERKKSVRERVGTALERRLISQKRAPSEIGRTSGLGLFGEFNQALGKPEDSCSGRATGKPDVYRLAQARFPYRRFRRLQADRVLHGPQLDDQSRRNEGKP